MDPLDFRDSFYPPEVLDYLFFELFKVEATSYVYDNGKWWVFGENPKLFLYFSTDYNKIRVMRESRCRYVFRKDEKPWISN